VTTDAHQRPLAAARDDAALASRLRLVVMRFTRRLRRQAGDDLSPSLVSVLACLERRGPLTLGELAALEHVKPPSVTRMIAALESRELVRREADPSDGRVSRVSVTATGGRTLQRSRTRKTAYLAKRLATLNDEDAAALAKALAVLERLLEIDR
jgi:DNA-binding MarR family transcriptional regulator